jgi:post-segregation antitoxin (ccd killing protein)
MTTKVKRRAAEKTPKPTQEQASREERWRQWRIDNAAAIEEYNRIVEREGTFADQLRRER